MESTKKYATVLCHKCDAITEHELTWNPEIHKLKAECSTCHTIRVYNNRVARCPECGDLVEINADVITCGECGQKNSDWTSMD